MPDPGGKGIYFVNGKSSGFLTAYHVHSKESTDIVSEDASRAHHLAGWEARDVHHAPRTRRSELWVSDIDGGNKVKIATGEDLGTGTWAPDNFHLSFEESGPAQGPKPTSSGPMAAVFVSSHGRRKRPEFGMEL